MRVRRIWMFGLLWIASDMNFIQFTVSLNIWYTLFNKTFQLLFNINVDWSDSTPRSTLNCILKLFCGPNRSLRDPPFGRFRVFGGTITVDCPVHKKLFSLFIWLHLIMWLNVEFSLSLSSLVILLSVYFLWLNFWEFFRQ